MTVSAICCMCLQDDNGVPVRGCLVRHARLLQGPRGKTGEEAGDEEEGAGEGEGVDVAGCRRACIERIDAEAEKRRKEESAKLWLVVQAHVLLWLQVFLKVYLIMKWLWN